MSDTPKCDRREQHVAVVAWVIMASIVGYHAESAQLAIENASGLLLAYIFIETIYWYSGGGHVSVNKFLRALFRKKK